MQKRSLLVMSSLGALVLTCGLAAEKAPVNQGKKQDISSQEKKSALKVGWVSQNAVSKSKEGQELEKMVMGEHRKLAQDVERKQKEYSDAATSFNTKAAALNAEARDAEGEKVAKLKRDYEEAAQKAERTMQRKMQEATQEALKSFAVAAEEYAQKKGFDVLLSESGVVYVNKAVDTTDEVSSIMNKQYDIKLAQNKKAEGPAAMKTATASKDGAKKAEQAKAV